MLKMVIRLLATAALTIGMTAGFIAFFTFGTLILEGLVR